MLIFSPLCKYIDKSAILISNLVNFSLSKSIVSLNLPLETAETVISPDSHFPGMAWIYGLLFIFGVYYAYKVMWNFYVQGRGKTAVKFFLFNLLASFPLAFFSFKA
jgi:hypothetical protein